MSMWLNVVSLSPDSFWEVLQAPELLENIFFDDDTQPACARLGVGDDDVAGVDYVTLTEAVTAIAEAGGREGRVTPNLLQSGELDYDAGHGPALFWDPAGLKVALQGSDAWSIAEGLDDELRALLATARHSGRYVVGVIS